MIARALTLPVLCTALLLAGCQPKPSKEYMEALAELEVATNKHCEALFGAIEAGFKADGDAETRLAEDNKKAKDQMDRILERVAALRPKMPNAAKYASAKKEMEESEVAYEDLMKNMPRSSDEIPDFKIKYMQVIKAVQDLNEKCRMYKP